MPLSRASSTRPRVVCDWWPSRCRPTMSNILHSREENFTEPFKEAGTLHASTPNLTLSTVYLGGHLQYEQTSSSFLCTQCMGVATRQLLIHMPGLLYSLCHYLPLSHAHFSFLLLLKSSLMQPLCISQSHLITVPQVSPSFTVRHFIQPQLHK